MNKEDHDTISIANETYSKDIDLPGLYNHRYLSKGD